MGKAFWTGVWHAVCIACFIIVLSQVLFTN